MIELAFAWSSIRIIRNKIVVVRLRGDNSLTVSLATEKKNQVVGHIAASPSYTWFHGWMVRRWSRTSLAGPAGKWNGQFAHQSRSESVKEGWCRWRSTLLSCLLVKRPPQGLLAIVTRLASMREEVEQFV